VPTINLDPRLAAFLDLIAWSEGTSRAEKTTADGYDVIVSGVSGPNYFSDFSTHPFALGRAPILVHKTTVQTVAPDDITKAAYPPTISPAKPALYSTASGRYQIELETWLELAAELKLGTFSPRDQDLAGVGLVNRRRAQPMILANDPTAAIYACRQEWASFPGNNYDQGNKTLAALLDKYAQLLGGTTAA
jgi:muramidase (phage lysozyme)